MRYRFALLFVFAAVTTAQAASTVTSAEIRSLLADRKSVEARTRIQNATNRDEFLKTPEGQALYAGSLCFSPPRHLSPGDVDNALRYAAAAETALSKTDAALASWTRKAAGSCELLRQQVARGQRDTRLAEFSGKIMGGCGPNPSSIFLPAPADPGMRSSILASYLWVPVIPALDGDAPPIPPDDFLAAAKADHLAPNPSVAVCAPFVAVSSDGKPSAVCDAMIRYYGHFREAYQAAAPASWITVHHYAKEKQMKDHVRKHRGPNCTGTLGYYDWHRQSIAFLAPAGLFGTLQHEMTHALLFWDIPMAPRWFEEGLAALYENTDPGYRGVPNPWREKILKRLGNPAMTPAYFSRVLKLDIMEFERSPDPATLSRALMMRLQRCGNLPGLYRDIRESTVGLSPQEKDPGRIFDRPPETAVAAWQDMLMKNDCR